jgi:transposase-like protein
MAGEQFQIANAETGPADPPPSTLKDAMAFFSDAQHCVEFVASRRWPGGVVRCPVCGASNTRFLAGRQIWECKSKHAKSQFSARAGTLFEDSHIPLCDWLIAVWILANSERKISSYELARQLGVTQKSAWSMLRRIKTALRLKNYRIPSLPILPAFTNERPL